MLIQWQGDTLIVSDLALAILEALDEEMRAFRECPAYWCATVDADPNGVLVRLERKAKRARKRISQTAVVQLR